MTPAEAVLQLDEIDVASDPEGTPGAAADILLALLPPEVEAAYERLITRAERHITRTASWWPA